jgi:LysW-gamma-L-lysine carboxypeptidase
MLEIESLSGQEAALAQFLRDELASLGFDTELDAVGNLIARIGCGPKRVFLVGHLDTVPGKIPVRLVDGKLYGRGAVDAKGSLAAFIESTNDFKDSRELMITVIGCVGEEADSQGARFLMTQNLRPDYVIIGEPSGWDSITLGYKGSVRIHYERHRPLTHRGHEAQTAAEEAFRFFEKLKSKYRAEAANFDSVDVNLVAINTKSDGLMESAVMTLDVRTPLNFDFAEFTEFLGIEHGDALVTLGPATAAWRADKKNALVRAFLGAIRANGGNPTFKLKTGTSDMNLLGPAWGVPMIAYGPGDSALDHTPKEHLDLAEYQKTRKILKLALQKLVG